MFGDSEVGVGEAAELLGLNKADGFDAFSEIASLQAAWSTLKCFQQGDDKQRAETKLLGPVTPMKSSEYRSTRDSFECAQGELADHLAPAQSILDKMESDIEAGQHLAPRLREQPSKEELDKASEGRIDSSGYSYDLDG